MNAQASSSPKVPYDLRTAKQIERRMIIDAFQRMGQSGFKIGDYKYIGMGGIYFVDFVLFHRLLGIQMMLSVERDENIKKRVQFNRPYRSIELEYKAIGDVIPFIDQDLKHILWLDYDFIMSNTVVTDAVNASAQLSVGSVLLITVDLKPPPGKPKDWKIHFQTEALDFCNPAWRISDFRQSNLPRINIDIIDAAIRQGLTGRPNVKFLPLFNFLYADGHEMLTVGGVIGTDAEDRMLDGCRFGDAPYIRRKLSDKPYRVPKMILTRKERVSLDAAMPAKPGWHPKEFEMDEEVIALYKEVYRFFPTYAELLL